MVNVIPSGDIENQPIHIVSGGGGASVTASNIADFYKLAKLWATYTGGLVENIDYSAKQYALNAAASATSAETAKDLLLSDEGFIAVSQDLENIDLLGENIGYIQTLGNNFNIVSGVYDGLTAIDGVYNDLTNIDLVANDLENIDNAQGYANSAAQSATNAAASATSATSSANAAAISEDNAEVWAEGTDEEVQALGGVHSAKGWAEESATVQVNSNFTETNPASKSFILNKPTKTIRVWY